MSLIDQAGRGGILSYLADFAHEPLFLEAGRLLRESKLGPVLYWMLQAENSFSEGNAWLATEWRNVPDYQGGEWICLFLSPSTCQF